MIKRALQGLIWFLAGITLAYTVFFNPFGWVWIDSLAHLIPVHDHAEGTLEGEFEGGQQWTCGMHPQVIQDEPGTCPICGMDLTPLKGNAEEPSAPRERKIKHWVAPMDPTYISDEPGKSPMGMDLIPVYEGPEDYTGVVHVSRSFVQNIGVETTPVRRRDISHEIRTIGTVAYNEKALALVNVKYSGWLEAVSVNYIGEAVSKGQKLFEVHSPELVTTQKEYLNALDYVQRVDGQEYPDIERRARSLLDSARERLQFWDISDQQIQELERSREPQRALPFYSPVSGVVISKMDAALDGMFVRPGMNLYKLADLSSVWVEAEIFEHQMPWLELGQSARVEFSSLGGKAYSGRVRFIYPYFDPRSRTARVSLEVQNPGGALKTDMYADVTFDLPSARGVLTVPEESVIHSGERNVVVLDRGEGTFQVREVELGLNGDGVWEVRSGISEGDQIVVSSQFLIDSESNLREAIAKMMAAQEGPQAD